MFPVIHGIVSVLVRRDSGAAIEPHIELGNLFTLRLVVLAVLHVGKDRLLGVPLPPTRSAAKVIGIVFLNKRRVSSYVCLYRSILHCRDRSDGIPVVNGAGTLAKHWDCKRCEC